MAQLNFIFHYSNFLVYQIESDGNQVWQRIFQESRACVRYESSKGKRVRVPHTIPVQIKNCLVLRLDFDISLSWTFFC